MGDRQNSRSNCSHENILGPHRRKFAMALSSIYKVDMLYVND